jgi:hypothetical protein
MSRRDMTTEKIQKNAILLAVKTEGAISQGTALEAKTVKETDSPLEQSERGSLQLPDFDLVDTYKTSTL